MQINSNQKSGFPKIFINDNICPDVSFLNPEDLPTPKNENLTPSPQKQVIKKPSTLHTKRFSVNLFPKKSLPKPSSDLTQKHQMRKSSLEMGLENIEKEAKSEDPFLMKKNDIQKKFVKKETLRKKAINVEEDREKTEKRLFLTQYFFESMPPDFIIERTKISKNWLKNMVIERYPIFILNAFHLNMMMYDEFEAKKLQNKEKEAALNEEIQKIVNKRAGLESYLPERKNPKIMYINQKYNTDNSEGIVLVKTGSNLPFAITRRVFFVNPAYINSPETEKRYSFIQIKEKGAKVNQKNNNNFKEYPLPEHVLLERKNKNSKYIHKWKMKNHEFRVSVLINSRANLLFLYSKTESEALEISNYLKFKSFLRIMPQDSHFWSKLAMIFYGKIANKMTQFLKIYCEKLFHRSELFKNEGNSSSSGDDDDSSNSKQEIIPSSSSSITKTRAKDTSLTRKTQQLFLVLKCLQEDYVKHLVGKWLKTAYVRQKEHFESHRSFYGLEPREIMFFESRKKRMKEIETLKKEGNIMNVERFAMRLFIANWLEMSSKFYKEKLMMKITGDNNNLLKKKITLKIKLKAIEIPFKLDYFKPKIKLKLFRKEIDKPRYLFIDRKRVLVEKKEYFQIVLETHLKERKMPGLLSYEILCQSIEISDYEPNQDFLVLEIFDDSCLSIYEKFKNPLSFNLPNESQDKKLEKLDINLFLASSRLITHKTQVALQELANKSTTQTIQDFWFSLDYCLDLNNNNKIFYDNNNISNVSSSENIGKDNVYNNNDEMNRIRTENQRDFQIFLNLETISQSDNDQSNIPHDSNQKLKDSVFNINLVSFSELFLDPKNLKKLSILHLLSGSLSEETILRLSHESDVETQVVRISQVLALKINELICKSYVQSFLQSTFWFMEKMPTLSDENSIKTRSFFFHFFSEFHSKNQNSLEILAFSGIPNQIRRLLWGFHYRDEVFNENLAKFTLFRSENQIVKPLPSPLIEETLYLLFQDEEILLNFDLINYLCFLQDVTHEIKTNIRKNMDFYSFLKRNSHHQAILRLMKAVFFWSFINNSRIVITSHIIVLIIRVFMVFEGNYPYSYNSCFDNRLFKRISPSIYLESDVFWCFITIFSVYFPRYFLLEAPKNALESSNHYCHSDLRGIKGDLFWLKLYLEEKYLDSLFSQEFFKDFTFEGFLSEVLLSLGIEVLNKRTDIWTRLFDRILLLKLNNEENFLIMGLMGALFAKIMRRGEKTVKKMRNFKDFKLILFMEINLTEDVEGFLDLMVKEKKMIIEFKEKFNEKINKFEQKFLLSQYFVKSNRYNKILYNFIEQIKPFNKFDNNQKLALSDLYSILSIENLLKEEAKSIKPCFLHIFIYNLTLFYSSSFEGELILELICEENIREIPIKLIIDTRIEINHYLCLKIEFNNGNSFALKINIYQTFSENKGNKGQKKLLKTTKIPLAALNPGILYKNSYQLISPEPDYNFLTSQISISLLLGPYTVKKAMKKLTKEDNIFFLLNRSLKKSLNLLSTTNQYDDDDEDLIPKQKQDFIELFRNVLISNNEILTGKIKDENSLDESQIAENSASCELDVFPWKSLSGIDYLSFLEISKKLFPHQLQEKQEKISILFEELRKVSDDPSKIDFFEFFAGLIIMLSGSFECKFELFYKLLVMLNKGNQEIPIYLFKGFIIRIYRFLGYFVCDSNLENFIDNAYFMNEEEFEDSLIEKAEIRQIGKKEPLVFDITNVLNDFIVKKQEIFHCRDLILGSAEDLLGLREIIRFYSENNNEEKYQDIKPLMSINTQENPGIFEFEIKYKSNQGLRQVFKVKFDENWKLIEEDAIFISKTFDFLLRNEQISVVQPKVLNKGFFYNHRNVLVLSSQTTSIMKKKHILSTMNSLPLFKYLFSLQNLHKIFNKLQENEISSFNYSKNSPFTIGITLNLENGVKFEAKVNIEKNRTIMNLKGKLNGLKAKKLALLLDNNKNFSLTKDNNKSLLSKSEIPQMAYEIILEKAGFFAPMKETFQRLLIKIMKKIKQFSNEDVCSKYVDFIHIFPVLNISQKALSFNNPVDIENLSFFSIYFLNKRVREVSFEASFIRKLSRKEEDFSIIINPISKKTRSLGLYCHCDQSTQWLPVHLIHSFLPIEFLIKKQNTINGNFNWNDKHNYEHFTVCFKKFPHEILIKKPNELVFLRKQDLRNMQIPNEFNEFLPKLNKVPKWKKILQGKEEKIMESIFKEIQQEDLVVNRKSTIDERKRIERKPGKRVLSYIPKKMDNN